MKYLSILAATTMLVSCVPVEPNQSTDLKSPTKLQRVNPSSLNNNLEKPRADSSKDDEDSKDEVLLFGTKLSDDEIGKFYKNLYSADYVVEEKMVGVWAYHAITKFTGRDQKRAVGPVGTFTRTQAGNGIPTCDPLVNPILDNLSTREKYMSAIVDLTIPLESMSRIQGKVSLFRVPVPLAGADQKLDKSEYKIAELEPGQSSSLLYVDSSEKIVGQRYFYFAKFKFLDGDNDEKVAVISSRYNPDAGVMDNTYLQESVLNSPLNPGKFWPHYTSFSELENLPTVSICQKVIDNNETIMLEVTVDNPKGLETDVQIVINSNLFTGDESDIVEKSIGLIPATKGKIKKTFKMDYQETTGTRTYWYNTVVIYPIILHKNVITGIPNTKYIKAYSKETPLVKKYFNPESIYPRRAKPDWGSADGTRGGLFSWKCDASSTSSGKASINLNIPNPSDVVGNVDFFIRFERAGKAQKIASLPAKAEMTLAGDFVTNSSSLQSTFSAAYTTVDHKGNKRHFITNETYTWDVDILKSALEREKHKGKFEQRLKMPVRLDACNK